MSQAACRLRRKRLFNPTQLPEGAAANNSSEIKLGKCNTNYFILHAIWKMLLYYYAPIYEEWGPGALSNLIVVALH